MNFIIPMTILILLCICPAFMHAVVHNMYWWSEERWRPDLCTIILCMCNFYHFRSWVLGLKVASVVTY